MRSHSDWDRVHAIRQGEIFAKYHPPGTEWWVPYDPLHPDDRDPANTLLVQTLGAEVVGTCRVDGLPGDRAAIRLVGVDRRWQGFGLGAALLAGAEAIAAAMGAHTACLNAQPGVLDFYARQGWQPAPWAGSSRCPRSIPMCKGLRLPAMAG